MPVNELTSGSQGLTKRSHSAINLSNSNTSSSSVTTVSGSSTLARQWSPPRVIELFREPDQGLGISIVGGKVDLFNLSPGHSIGGIFVKNILPGSPAAKSGLLKRGDRILEVDGKDLRDATHDAAVEAIRSAQNPIKFIVQSLLPLPREDDSASSRKVPADSSSNATLAAITSVTDEDYLSERDNTRSDDVNSLPKSTSDHLRPPEDWRPPRTPSPVIIQEGLDDGELQESQAQLLASQYPQDRVTDEEQSEEEVVVKKLPKTKTLSLASEPTEDSDSEEEEINVRDTKGKVFSAKGVEVGRTGSPMDNSLNLFLSLSQIDRTSAGNVKLSPNDVDKDEEDDFGYTISEFSFQTFGVDTHFVSFHIDPRLQDNQYKAIIKSFLRSWLIICTRRTYLFSKLTSHHL